MSRVLTRYLIITGIMTTVVLMMPGVVWIGLLLGGIPGLILSFAPTAFMWGCIFAGPWALARMGMSDRTAAILALAILGGVLWFLPQPSRHESLAQLQRFHLASVRPKALIKPVGDVRLDMMSFSSDPNKCGDMCLALLFEPGVRSVTLNLIERVRFSEIRNGTTPLQPSAQTYRLLPKGQCAAKFSRFLSISSPFGRTSDDNRLIEADWKRRLTDEVCLQAYEPIDHYDLLLRAGQWNGEEVSARRLDPWSLTQNNVNAGFADARTGDGKVLMRYYNVRASALSAPFRITGNGGIDTFRFRWAREELSQNSGTSWEGEEPNKQLDTALAVQRKPDLNKILVPLRATLLRSLSDPSLSAKATVFDAVGNYLALLNRNNAGPQDREIIERLIDDPRVESLPNAYRLPAIFDGSALTSIRSHLVRKLLDLPPTAEAGTKQIGNAFENWPAGTFAKLTPEETLLLNDPDRRMRATSLISRVSDQGAAGAPLLARILLDHHNRLTKLRRDRSFLPEQEKQQKYEANVDTFDTAVSALCTIGPAARNVLPSMMKLDADKDERWFDQPDWDRMMARIGKPIAQFESPANMSGNNTRYQAELQDFVGRFRPGQCR